MSIIIKVSRTKSLESVRKELSIFHKKQAKNMLKDYFGALPSVFGDPLTYQKQIRNEWE